MEPNYKEWNRITNNGAELQGMEPKYKEWNELQTMEPNYKEWSRNTNNGAELQGMEPNYKEWSLIIKNWIKTNQDGNDVEMFEQG